MKPLKLVLIFAVVVLLAVGGLSVAIAAVTAPPNLSDETATLSVQGGTVQLLPSGASDWQTVASDTEVHPGDQVKTGADGSASINFFDQGETRLDVNTTITITQAQWDANQPDVFNGNVLVQTGRLWSRLFDFISPKSSFDVQTTNTVATVRGTIFSVWAAADGTSGVYVDEHAVHVTSGSSAEDVDEGWLMKVTPSADHGSAQMDKTQGLDAGWQAWVKLNRMRDTAFDQQVMLKMKTRMHGGSPFLGMAQQMRLMMTIDSAKRDALQQDFQLRQRMIQRTRRDSVPPAMTQTGAQAPTTDAPLVVTSSSSFTITTGGTTTMLDGTPITESAPTTDTSTNTPSSSTSSSTDASTSTTTPTASEPTPVSITVTADTSMILVTDNDDLHAIITYSDGSTADVAKEATWSVDNDPQTGSPAGSVVLGVFYPKQDGTANITADYVIGTLRLEGTTTITVITPVLGSVDQSSSY